MKTTVKSLYSAILAIIFSIALSGCDNSNVSDLDLGNDTRVEKITVSGFDGEINHAARTINVNVSTDVDLENLRIDAITISEGATCNYPAGTIFNGSMPRAIHVTNGDVYTDYTLTVKHDNAEFLSFTLNSKYSGTIDNAAHTILIFVPIDTDVTAMQVSFTVSDETSVDPENGSIVDFSEPVEFTATCRTAVVKYLVTVVRDSMSQEPKAFIGNASNVDGLGDEAKAACRWMLDNVPNSRFVSLKDVLDGTVHLDDFKMIWCHFDWTDWPGVMWDTRDLFNSYWLHGGSILASRDGARYINDVWRIARDQQSPNNMFGGDSFETLADPLGFSIKGHEDHPLFKDIPTDSDSRVLLLDKGCSNSNRTLQWGVDWDPYGSMAGWEEKTGAKALASAHDYDVNRVTIAEFEPYEALKGFTSGCVITIGTPAFEWNDRNGADNKYRPNIENLTKNAINYLCK